MMRTHGHRSSSVGKSSLAFGIGLRVDQDLVCVQVLGQCLSSHVGGPRDKHPVLGCDTLSAARDIGRRACSAARFAILDVSIIGWSIAAPREVAQANDGDPTSSRTLGAE
ncbi:MAG: hypothetical protein FWD57_10310 [Polyangiaceae bacterium]|nr:hypothetical protein [Polyangiaceae bacterium]